MQHRIAQLPRRDWRDLEAESVSVLTDLLKTPQGSQELRGLQAVAVREAPECGGAYIMGRVGIGKTLISLLVGEFMREERVLILVPGGIKGKTEDEFDEYRSDWKGICGTRYKLLGYSDVSAMPKEGLSIQKLWGGLGPTLIIPDEADKLRRVDPSKGASGLALQVSDYLAANPSCKVVALTGTPDKHSILDYAHILQWCLREGSPLPTNWDDLADWAEVIDKGDPRCAKKVCNQLGIPETEDIEVIRAGYQDRLRATPGVIISDDQFDGPLEFRSVLREPVGMEAHFFRLRKLNQRPDGWDISPDGAPSEDEERHPDRVTAGSMWSCARQLALDFCYVADPPAPEPWMEARRDYFKAVRSALRNGVYYTEMQFKQAAARGELPKPIWGKVWAAWEKIKPTFEPHYRPLWLGNRALDFCQEWGEQAPGIIWVDHIAFGMKLAQQTGWSYHAGGGKDGRGKVIDKLYKKGQHATQTVIAARGANSTGRNLQAWNRALVTACPANNRDFEQMVGREHRELQDRPVTVDILIGCREHVESVGKILLDGARQTTTLMKQKVSCFDWKHLAQDPKGIAYE